MNIRHLAGLLFFSLLLLSSCSKYETQYEGPYSEADPEPKGPAYYDMVFVLDNQLYMASADLKQVKKLNIPTSISRASINFSHTRIAYQPAFGGNLVVIDTSGAQIATVPNSEGATDFDWHANNETLYFLDNNDLRFFGPNVMAAHTDLDNAHPYFGVPYYHSVTVLPNGAVAFGFSVSGGPVSYTGFRIAYTTQQPGQQDRNLAVSGQFPGKIRTTLDGSKLFVIAGSQCGTFNSQGSSSLTELAANVSQAALSPDGSQFVYWSPNDLSLLLLNTQFSAGIGFGQVTDIDW
jgi:hypothetical protein